MIADWYVNVSYEYQVDPGDEGRWLAGSRQGKMRRAPVGLRGLSLKPQACADTESWHTSSETQNPGLQWWLDKKTLGRVKMTSHPHWDICSNSSPRDTQPVGTNHLLQNHLGWRGDGIHRRSSG